MKKNKNKKKHEKNNTIILIISLIIVFLIVMNLQNINSLFTNQNHEEIEELEEKEKIPTRYQCFYGPMVDEFYNYIESEYVVLNFDKIGNVSSVKIEEKYQAITSNDYSQMLEVLSLENRNVSYDEENYVVTIISEASTKFPSDYKTLKKYLSSHQYTCSEE